MNRARKRPKLNDNDDEYLDDDDSDIEDDMLMDDNGNGLPSLMNGDGVHEGVVVNDDDEETVDEKRLRIARRIVEETTRQAQLDAEADDAQRDAIAHRLYQHVLEDKGILQRPIAKELSQRKLGQENVRSYRGHSKSATCVALSYDGVVAVTGSKDGTVVQWDVSSGRKLHVYRPTHSRKSANANGHTGDITGVALSYSGKLLATCGSDKAVKLWDLRTHELLHTFSGHREKVTGVTFRLQSDVELFSTSADRTVKVWNTEQLAYVDTLFGHQHDVTAIDSLTQNRALTCGTDHSIRLWKVEEESQLVWRVNETHVDCVSMLNEDKFVSGAQDGSVSLWSTRKKKPTCTIANAHNGQWITAVGAHRYSDVALSGSSDGFVRVWECSNRKMQKLHEVPVVGFVNDLCVATSGQFAVAAIGQEHRLGRWTRICGARNGLGVISLGDAQS